jgi:hypothetical protein
MIGVDWATRPAWASGVSVVELDNEIVCYDGESLHHLNASAALVWKACDGSATIAEIAVRLAQDASVEREVVERDVLATVRGFVDHALCVES